MAGTTVNIGREGVVRGPEGWIRRRTWGTWGYTAFLFASVGFGIPIALAAFFAIRLPRAGIRMSGDGIVVRVPVRTRSVDLRDAERFVHGQLQSTFAGEVLRCTYGVQLERREGAPIPVWALQRGQWNNEEGRAEGADAWRPVCRRLNEELLAQKGGAVPDLTDSKSVEGG